MRLKKDLISMLGVSRVNSLKTLPCWCRTMLVRYSVFYWILKYSSAISRTSTSSWVISI